MKKDITVTVKDYICDEVLIGYYRELWRMLGYKYGNDILVEINKRYSEKIRKDNSQAEEK